ncbi:MAG TPA: hypothetical protein VFU94_07855 [Conexibacter sp.]|nr:hypothetical protein [Conexibacter sp.]
MDSLLSAASLSRDDVERLLRSARTHLAGGGRRHPDALVALLFFDASLRTRVGFEAAAARLGARTTTTTELRRAPSMEVAEAVEDAARSIAPWCDAICLRHADAGVPARVAGLVGTPVVNCGNGGDEHPSQALADLFAIAERRGRIDGVRVTVVGDLHGMRAVHSLVLLLARFDDVSVRCVAPPGCGLPERFAAAFRAAGGELVEHERLAVADADVLYVAGLPAITSAGRLAPAERRRYLVTRATLAQLPAHAEVLCPLPRVDEIARDVDELPQAGYFRQSALALGMRMAVLDELLTRDGDGAGAGARQPGSGTPAPAGTKTS